MRRALPLGVLVLVALAPALRAEDQGGFLAKVKAAMSEVKTTRGRFKQTKTLAIFEDKVETSGTFAIQRPDRLRWEIAAPFRSILVLKGQQGARWNETRKAVERFSLADKPGIDTAVKQMFTWYSGSFEDVSSTFDLTLDADGRTVSLVPKNEKVREVLSRVTIQLAPGLRTIESIALEEKAGDRTDLVFEAVETNAELPETTFELDEKTAR